MDYIMKEQFPTVESSEDLAAEKFIDFVEAHLPEEEEDGYRKSKYRLNVEEQLIPFSRAEFAKGPESSAYDENDPHDYIYHRVDLYMPITNESLANASCCVRNDGRISFNVDLSPDREYSRIAEDALAFLEKLKHLEQQGKMTPLEN